MALKTKAQVEEGTSAQVTKKRKSRLDDGGTPSLFGTIIKILLIGIVDAISFLIVMTFVAKQDWVMTAVVGVVTLLLNFIFLRRGGLPAKYLAPGLVFMAIFQFYVVGFSGYIAFTNYGGGHIGTKEQAINAIKLNSNNPVEGAPSYPINVVKNDAGDIGFLITKKDEVTGETTYELGSATVPLHPVENPIIFADLAASAEGYNAMKLPEIRDNFDKIKVLQVVVDEAEGTFYMTASGSEVTLFKAGYIYDPVKDSVLKVDTGVIYTDQGNGSFQSPDGEELLPGWRSEVGFANFIKAVNEERIRGPLLMVTAWTFAFAAITVLVTFAMGLGLALLFNDDRMKFKRFYRIVMILPYAFPAFLSALIWTSMFNTKEGFINNVILGGLQVPWLQDPFWAKVAVLLVNFWLGFPYMFLITTGALQAIPSELTESAKIDGATAWQQFRFIKLPLLLVSISPLLITSFAYNFNNFTLIYLVTGGGPKVIEADMNVGHTDILITLVYKIAFNTGKGADYGLASAFSILIFLVVGTISYLGFRRTRTLEDQD